MKQAFDGEVYDTETATVLGYSPPSVIGHSRYLYRTPDGAFFLYQVSDSKAHDVAYAVFTDPSTGWFTKKHYPKITPLSTIQAIDEFHHLKKRCLDFARAFPDRVYGANF